MRNSLLSIKIVEHDANLTDLERITRAIISARHEIPMDEVHDHMEEDPSLADEFDRLMDGIALDKLPDDPPGILFFEVTESPDTDMVLHGRSFAIIKKYRLNPILVSNGHSQE